MGAARHAVPRLATALALALALGLSACGGGRSAARFERARSQLDAALAAASRGAALDAAFDAAYRSASSSAEWLSILKRAREVDLAGDRGRYVAAADAALKGAPRSEPVAAAAAHAFVRAGRGEAALALFGKELSIDSRPSLWAEAYIAALASGRGGRSAEPSDLAKLAEISGEPRLFVSAAALRVAAPAGPIAPQVARGRPPEAPETEAAAWLAAARAGGIDPGAALLWDCGLYRALAERRPGTDPLEAELAGDAAWTIGDRETARRLWERSIAIGPRASWRAYANLANLANLETSPERDPERAAMYWRRLRAAFLDVKLSAVDPRAVAAYAAALARGGRDAEALALLAPFEDEVSAGGLALAIRGKSWGPERYAGEAIRFVSAHPDDGDSLALTLPVLAVRNRFDDLAVLVDSADRRGLDYPYRWFFRAAVAAARGDAKSAADILEKAGPAVPGPEAAFALGILYRASGDPERAVARLQVARDSSAPGQQRARALKELGAAYAEAGDQGRAASTYREAAKADPSDSEAAFLAKDPGRKKAK